MTLMQFLYSYDQSGMLSKSLSSGRKSRSSSGTFSSFSDVAAQVVREENVKSVLEHRRRHAEKKKAVALSTTEKVLRFLQSHTSVLQLEQASVLRDKRAVNRTKGDL